MNLKMKSQLGTNKLTFPEIVFYEYCNLINSNLTANEHLLLSIHSRCVVYQHAPLIYTLFSNYLNNVKLFLSCFNYVKGKLCLIR